MKKIMTRLSVLAVVVAAASSIFVPSHAQADNGPDTVIGAQQYPDVTGGYGSSTQGHASYVVSQDGGLTNIKTTTIKIYVPASISSTQIKVHNYDMCTLNAPQLKTTNSYDQSLSTTDWLAGSSNIVASYALSGGGAQTFNGHWSKSCASSVKTLTLSGAPVDSSIGYRTYRLTVTGNTESSAGARYVNLFWLSGANDVIFSQDSGQSVQSFGYQLSSPIPTAGAGGGGDTYYRTALPFGSACSVKSATTAQMSFYDLDSGSGTVQPKDLHIQVKDVTAGNVGLPLTKLAGDGSLSGGSAGNQYKYAVKGGNRQTVNVRFTAQPGHRYILWMSDIFYNNTLQFKLPYDSIYYYATCQNANLSGNTTLDNQLLLPGQTATWAHYMANTDNVGTAMNVNAQIHRTITDKSGALKSNTSTALVSGATIGPNSKNPDPPKQTTFTAQPDDIGSTICEWITWTWNGGSGDNQSNDYCTVVAKKPKVQIIGGDVRVGGEVDTSSQQFNGNTYGSWGEYGALINEQNLGNRFGSGAALRGGGSGNTTPMTFANNDSAQTGKFNQDSLNNQDLTGVIKTAGLPTSCSAGSLSSGGCTTNSSAAISLNGATIPSGATVYINAPNAAVTITGDIKYATASSIQELPQAVIRAKSIIIKDTVTQVDAWLLTPTDSTGATTTLTTCSAAPTSCTGQLVIHGPVATKNLALPRIAGSDGEASLDKPAETFNLRADSYLWAYNQQLQNYSPQTVQVTNLPPRY